MASRKSEPTALSRPVTWVRDLLQRPVKLELRGAQVHVVLGEKSARQAAVSTGLSAGEALRRSHAELGSLLRRHPDAREMMRHLGYVHQQIARFGSRALKREIPVPVLRKALEQLELLVEGAPSEGLIHLRARMVEVVASRGQVVEMDRDTETRPGSLEVREASHSLFDEMERSWTGQIPPDPAKAPARG